MLFQEICINHLKTQIDSKVGRDDLQQIYEQPKITVTDFNSR